MPTKGTPVRTIRIADDIWKPAKQRAEREGRELHDVVRQHLAEYGAESEPSAMSEETHEDLGGQ